MKQPKAFLALKAVNSQSRSLLATREDLSEYYGELGSVHRCKHPLLPFFVVTDGDILSDDSTRVRVGNTYDHLLLVSVLAKDVVNGTPWGHFGLRAEHRSFASFEQIVANPRSWIAIEHDFVGATRLRVLEKVPAHVHLRQYLKEKAAQYHIGVLDRAKARAFGKQTSFS